jgi:hypothetical protein
MECTAMVLDTIGRAFFRLLVRRQSARAGSGGSSKLTAYPTGGQGIDIRPASLERGWMQATAQRFAYRCLPLDIANGHGWEILCRAGFTAIWNGGSGLDAIALEPDPDTSLPASSHFGHGVLTFHVHCLFQTSPGFDLMVQGPINRPKDAIAPLTGIVETDWSPYSFTMNWLFTRPGVAIRFEKGEPYCHIFPLRRGDLETVEPEWRSLSDNPELKSKHDVWSASRNQFNADLRTRGSQAHVEKWQKHYHHGVDLEGRTIAPLSHRTRLRLKPFAKG